MSQNLAGKVVLVTGASSGIGRALALSVAESGARVALAGRSEPRLQQVANLIGPNTLILPADLADAPSVDAIATKTLAHFGHIDILLANAGLYIPGDVADGDADAWDELVQVNVSSVFRLIRAVLPGMIARRSGDIIVTSSISGHQAIQWEPVYSASKHAIQSFVHGLRRRSRPIMCGSAPSRRVSCSTNSGATTILPPSRPKSPPMKACARRTLPTPYSSC
jgi:ribitol 2-dehydrogenase